jgi:hypothetical protein
MMVLRWIEFILGVGFLLGLYVRVCAAGLLLLALIATLLFQSAIYSYAGALVGVGIYLLCQGPGSYYLPLPSHPRFREMQAELAAVPRQRAQAIMRHPDGHQHLLSGGRLQGDAAQHGHRHTQPFMASA